MRRSTLLVLFGLLAGTLAVPAAEAQYFGRNKVQYRSFDFRLLRTEHFDVYYYPEEADAAQQAARMAERWFARLTNVLSDTLSGRQPLIMYASPTHFQQTNTIEGELGEGTGGVTESFKGRVVLPFANSLAETDHVLGHELVHAFQYDITARGMSGAPGASALPLWFIEGMAEYLSIGPHDPFTASWMREAVLRNDLPPLRRLDSYKYFPYRWGQAIWSYIGAVYGDEMVGQLLRAAARTRDPLIAIRQVLGVEPDTLSAQWHEAMRTAYAVPAEVLAAVDSGVPLLNKGSTGGRLNVGPALSPDGSRVAFVSERDLFSIEVFLADAETGRIQRRLTATARNPHLESIQFIASAGSFSPDGRRFALATTVRGRPMLQVINVDNGNTEHEYRLPGLDEIMNPTWAPDGRQVAFTGQAGGYTDLYVFDTGSNEMRRLTNDAFADLHPAWSPDGNTIAFVSDRFGTNVEALTYGRLKLAAIDPRSSQIIQIPAGVEGTHTNPQWGQGGRALYFLANPDGITNAYRVEPAGGSATRVTDLPSGVMGIAAQSPALAVATNADRMMVSVHRGQGNDIMRFDGAVLAGKPLATATPPLTTLAVGERATPSRVVAYLADPRTGLASAAEFRQDRYRSRLALDYIAPPTLAAGSDRLGTYVGGGTALFWSSMLGDQQLVTMLQVNGSLRDIAGQVGYLNRKQRFDWGIMASQVPYLVGGYTRTAETFNGQPAIVDREIIYRQTSRDLTGVISYPFSRVQRIEFIGGVRNISFSGEERLFAYDQNGFFLGEAKNDLPTQASLTLGQATAAMVYDNSLFGGTGPVTGRRWRLEVSPTFGALNYIGALADIRQYLMPARPLTFAARVMHYGRYGSDAQDPRLNELYLGYQSLVRGYDNGSFSNAECDPAAAPACPAFDQLFGSRLLVGNLEARLPILGPLGLVAKNLPLPVDLVLFTDAGVAWSQGESPSLFGGTRQLVASVGGGMRINIFGAVIAEIDLVRPFDRPGKGWYVQLGLTQGGF